MQKVTGVHYVTDSETPGTLKSYPALAFGDHEANATVPFLVVFRGGRSEVEHGPDGNGVPHGSASQGDTYY